MNPRFGPFGSRNYRLYFGGQALSLIGTWMQQVAQAWLVLTISHSGTILGLVVAAQTLPVLLLGAYGGLIADRVNKRKLMIATQVIMGTVSLTNGLLVATHNVHLAIVVCLALVMGLTNSVANPARQSFVSELVDRKNLRAAVSLNSVMVNTARAIGPAIAGVFIATIGVQLCFFCDAVSYLFVIAALLLMNTSLLNTPVPTVRAKGQIRQGLTYVRSVPTLFIPLVMMVVIGTFAYEFQVLLPLVATREFHGDASSLGILTSAQGIGAIAGGLYIARRGKTGIAAITRGALLFGLALILATLAPVFWLEVAALFIVGASSIQFLSVGNSTIQLAADPQYRGRVLALWSMAFLGTTPIGGPIVGWVSQHFSPRYAMGLGAVACLVSAAIGFAVLNRTKAPTEKETSAQDPAYTESLSRA
jgi:MFS family permease